MKNNSSEKVEIERLFRIKLSHLKPLLKAAEQLRELPPEEKKRKAYKMALTYTKEYYVPIELPLKVIYHFKPRTHLGTGEEILEEALLFQYTTPDGEKREMDIELEYRESNLGKGYREYYFRDKQYSLCRVLYSDRWGIYSRYQLRGRVRYEQQNDSRKMRKYNKHKRADRILHSLDGRHLLWKGQPTPIAKQALKAAELRKQEPKIFLTIWEDAKRGRKPQAEKAPPAGVNIAMY